MRQPARLLLLAVLAAVLLPTIAFAAQPDIAKHPACPLCGMNRETWAHSRIYVEFADGGSDGFCSVHCAAASLAVSLDRIPAAIWVGDYGTKLLVDAELATWVIGGTKSGVMTGRAKWAFADPAAAEAFVKENGGAVATFEVAMKSTYEDMYADTKMIRDRRAAKRKAAEDAKKAEAAVPAPKP